MKSLEDVSRVRLVQAVAIGTGRYTTDLQVGKDPDASLDLDLVDGLIRVTVVADGKVYETFTPLSNVAFFVREPYPVELEEVQVELAEPQAEPPQGGSGVDPAAALEDALATAHVAGEVSPEYIARAAIPFGEHPLDQAIMAGQAPAAEVAAEQPPAPTEPLDEKK